MTPSVQAAIKATWERSTLGNSAYEGDPPPQLAADAVHLWRTHVPTRSDAPTSDWQILTEDERERAQRLILPTRRADFVSMRAWLRRVLASYLRTTPSSIAFAYNPHGRPQLATTMHAPQIVITDFNLSHSERWAILAVSGAGPVGVDLEFCRAGRSFFAIGQRFFAPEEWKWFRGVASEHQQATFYAIWARKEAYLKALGTGLSLSSQSFAWNHVASMPCLLHTDPAWQQTLHWRVMDLDGWSDYRAALCWNGDAVRLRFFDSAIEV